MNATTPSKYDPRTSLWTGDLISVRYGETGTQVAVVVSVDISKSRVQVRKWLDNSRRYTNPVWVAFPLVVEAADHSDPRTLRALAALPR